MRLKASESAISDINRQLDQLQKQQKQAEQKLQGLQADQKSQQQLLTQRQAELADQLRAQYASGLSPWTALLSGDDPQEISRDLSYLSFVARAQADAVRAVRQTLEKLQKLSQQVNEIQSQLEETLADQANQLKKLEQQKSERQNLLAEISAQLEQQRSEAERHRQNEQRLAKLIRGLEEAITEQKREERLLAEAAKRREAERKLREQEKQLAEARRQVQEAKKAQEAQEARERAEQEAARRQAQESAQPQAPQAAPERLGEKPEPAQRIQPEPSLALPEGLSQGLPVPVRGEIQGRFGSNRPDGGVWRGVVIRADEGAAVQAVAAGKVVYASWLKGFGNIMIVDHGQGYLSIYAYNQSLLRQVGDTVAAKEPIATVGSTGGQVEPGLYFEIRHNGTPINPRIMLAFQ